MARTHWMDRANMTCICGKVSRSPLEEARHRHNFPILCRTIKSKKLNKDNSQGATTVVSVRSKDVG